MKKWLCLVLFLTTLTYSITALLPSRIRVSAAEDDLQLHAKYAVLLDGDSGRVLYGKNEDTPAPMASPWKNPTSRKVRLPDELTAARASLPRKFPTIRESAVLYSC